jgi:hypothetical protein
MNCFLLTFVTNFAFKDSVSGLLEISWRESSSFDASGAANTDPRYTFQYDPRKGGI